MLSLDVEVPLLHSPLLSLMSTLILRLFLSPMLILLLLGSFSFHLMLFVFVLLMLLLLFVVFVAVLLPDEVLVDDVLDVHLEV